MILGRSKMEGKVRAIIKSPKARVPGGPRPNKVETRPLLIDDAAFASGIFFISNLHLVLLARRRGFGKNDPRVAVQLPIFLNEAELLACLIGDVRNTQDPRQVEGKHARLCRGDLKLHFRRGAQMVILAHLSVNVLFAAVGKKRTVLGVKSFTILARQMKSGPPLRILSAL